METIVGTIDRVAFSFGPFTVYWYGIIIGAAMLLAISLASKEGTKRGLGEDTVTDMTMWAIPIGLIGARIYYILFEWQYYLQNPGEIVQIWNGGIAIYGGLDCRGIHCLLVHQEKEDSRCLDVGCAGSLCPFGPIHRSMGQLH